MDGHLKSVFFGLFEGIAIATVFLGGPTWLILTAVPLATLVGLPAVLGGGD
jgi:hypothetical protein